MPLSSFNLPWPNHPQWPNQHSRTHPPLVVCVGTTTVIALCTPWTSCSRPSHRCMRTGHLWPNRVALRVSSGAAWHQETSSASPNALAPLPAGAWARPYPLYPLLWTKKRRGGTSGGNSNKARVPNAKSRLIWIVSLGPICFHWFKFLSGPRCKVDFLYADFWVNFENLYKITEKW